MARPLIRPEQVADVIRRAAEFRHAVEELARQLDRSDSALARLAGVQLERVSLGADMALLGLQKAAKLLVSVADPDEDDA